MRSRDFYPNIAEYKWIEQGEVFAKAPSNIALVKYWGKIEIQIPANSSISYTLTNCFTETTLKFNKKRKQGIDVEVYLEGEKNEKFRDRIIHFFELIQPFVPFVQSYSFEVHTSNSFPHSSGIASSASGFAALAMCLVSMEKEIGALYDDKFAKIKTSFIARLGSGSACRSVFSGLVHWGEHPAIQGSNKRYAVAYPYEVAEVFKTFYDTVLIVEKGQKKVSSSVGHRLMDTNPYKESRIQDAQSNIEKLIAILESGDISGFGKLVEHEALSLHALMMTSDPQFILMQPNTLAIIHKIWEFRKTEKANVFFTLDAGANVHMLYPENEKLRVSEFLQKKLVQHLEDGKYIEDKVNWG